jgi:hypothetical protein
VTNEQLYLAIGVPILFNGMLLTILFLAQNRQIDALKSEMFARIDAINQRFDDMRDLWRSELHRVEEVLDARLKHLEEGRR